MAYITRVSCILPLGNEKAQWGDTRENKVMIKLPSDQWPEEVVYIIPGSRCDGVDYVGGWYYRDEAGDFIGHYSAEKWAKDGFDKYVKELMNREDGPC